MLTDDMVERMRDRVQTAYALHEADDTLLYRDYPDLPHDYATDVEALLAEVERLRAEVKERHSQVRDRNGRIQQQALTIAAMREIVQAVAALTDHDLLPYNGMVVPHAEGRQVMTFSHKIEPMCAQARALLARSDGGATGAAEAEGGRGRGRRERGRVKHRQFARDLAAWAITLGWMEFVVALADAHNVPINVLTIAATFVLTATVFAGAHWLIRQATR